MVRSIRTTTDHDEIRRWIDSRGGTPVLRAGPGGEELAIEFPGGDPAEAERDRPIALDEFLRRLDEAGLALLYDDQTAGGPEVRFYEVVPREG